MEKEIEASKLARAIYDAMREDAPDGFFTSFSTDDRVSIDGSFDLLAVARRAMAMAAN